MFESLLSEKNRNKRWTEAAVRIALVTPNIQAMLLPVTIAHFNQSITHVANSDKEAALARSSRTAEPDLCDWALSVTGTAGVFDLLRKLRMAERSALVRTGSASNAAVRGVLRLVASWSMVGGASVIYVSSASDRQSCIVWMHRNCEQPTCRI